MKAFSASWISSKKPNKQRKYRFNAPLHIRASFLNVHLSKELKNKYNTRAIRVRTGDKVRVLRGQFKKQEGRVEEVDTKKIKVFISKIEHVKRDGTKARYPLDPSNLMIVELNTDDKKRFHDNVKTDATKKPEQKQETKKAVQKTEIGSEQKPQSKSQPKSKAAKSEKKE